MHFWLEQNSKALGATIQALEVQKMTLATLKGMNFNIGDVANALKLKAAESVDSGVQRVTETAASTAKTISERGRRCRRDGQDGRQGCRTKPRPVLRRAGRPAAAVGRADAAVPADCRRRHERGSHQDGAWTPPRTWPPAWPRRPSRRPPKRPPAGAAAQDAPQPQEPPRRPVGALRSRLKPRGAGMKLFPYAHATHPQLADGGGPGAGAIARPDGAATTTPARPRWRCSTSPTITPRHAQRHSGPP